MAVNFSSIVSLITFFFAGGLLWIVLSRNLKSRIVRAFSLFLIAMLVWSLSAIFVYGFPNQSPDFWIRFQFVGALAIPLAFYNLVLAFLMRERKGWIVFGGILYLAAQIVNGLGRMITSVQVVDNQVTAVYGVWFLLAWLAGILFLVLSLVDLIGEYRKTVVISYRSQIRYLLITIALIALSVLLILVHPLTFPIDLILDFLAVALIYYAILKHELLDISILFHKSLVYSIPLILIGVIYFLVIDVLITQIHFLSLVGPFLLSLLVTVIAILIGRPVYNWVQSWVDRFFFRDRYNSTRMLQRLSDKTVSVLSLDAITQAILKEVTTTMHIRNAGFFLKKDQTGDYFLAAQEGMYVGTLKLAARHPLITYFEKDRAPITNYDLEVLPQFLGLWKKERDELEKTGAQLYIPLKTNGKLVGIFAVGPKESGDSYTEEDLLTLSALANQTAAVIENAVLFEAESKRRKEAETLQDILSELTSDLELQQVLDSILIQLEKVVPFNNASVFLLNRDALTVVAVRGFSQPSEILNHSIALQEDELFQELLSTRKPIFLQDVQADPRWHGYGNTGNVQSWICVPLLLNGNVIGCLALDSYTPATFSEFGQMDLLQTFASHAAVAVENARLFKVEREQRQTSDALREAGTMLSSSLDFERILDLLLDQIGRILPYDLANIMLADENHELRVVRTRLSKDIDPIQAPWIDEALTEISDVPNLQEMIQSNHPMVITDVSTHPGWIQKNITVPRSWAGAPVYINEKLAACFSLVKFERDFYTEQHNNLLSIFAGQAALALQNAHLFKEVQELAIYDDLTNLFNRRHLFELGRREFNRAQRFHRTLAVIMLDLDYFRNVNDEFGHAVGDQVLHLVAERCRKSIREVDVIGRYGGDEFTIICPEAGIEEARIVSDRLRKQIAHTPFMTTIGPLNLTASMGIAVMNDKTPDLAYLVDVADKAMYVAKHSGRDLVYKADEGYE